MIKKFKLLFSLQQISKIFPRFYPRTAKSSQYGKALCESNKIKKFYGDLSLKYLKKIFQKRRYFPFQKQETFFRFLESRLDVVLYRSGFFETLFIAKQQIHLGCIQVNKKIVLSPKHILQPGDIINFVSTGRKDEKLNFLLSKPKIKRKVVWRFKRSPFFLFLMNNNTNLTGSVEKLKTTNKIKRTIEFDNLFKCYGNDRTSQRKKIYFFENSNETTNLATKQPDFSLVQKAAVLNFNKEMKTEFQNNWLFSIYNLFLKKKWLSSQSNGLKQKNFSHLPNVTKQISNLQHTLFNAAIPEGDFFGKGKASKFNFFKDQLFFLSKKIKPSHLEISYKSRSIIFLFPPQRICLPNYINLSQIYK